MKLRTAYILISACLLVGAVLPAITLGQQADEYALKASYIDRFMQFVNWPERNGESPSRPFVISVIGKSPFDGSLEDIFAQGKPGDRKVQINYISGADEAGNCDLLFIAGSENDKLPQIMEHVADKAILTISDTNGFGSSGVIINFYIDGAKLHFEMNLRTARKSGLEFDPFLLDYAKILDSSEAPDGES